MSVSLRAPARRSRRTTAWRVVAIAAVLALPGAGHAFDAPDADDVRAETAASAETPVAVVVRLRGEDARAGVPASARARIHARQSRVLARLARHRLRHVRRFAGLNGLALELPASALAELVADPEVAAVGPDLPISAHLDSTVAMIHADTTGVEFALTGAGVTVAIVDSGLDTDHPDLAGAVVDERCFCLASGGCCPGGGSRRSGPGSAEDDHGHGTSVGGIVASRGRVAPPGVAPGASLVAVKVLSAAGSGFVSDVIAALDWLRAERPDVSIVNVSLGTERTYAGTCDAAPELSVRMLAEAVAAITAAGGSVVAASGNNGSSNAMIAPACTSDALAVGSVRDDDRVADFSNSGSELDLLAPGVGVRTSARGGGARSFSGTSAAAPHVAGTLALLREARPDAGASERFEAAQHTAVSVTDPRNGLTRPRIDAAASFHWICPGGADGDRDGLSDCLEIHVHRTDPMNPDTDGDGVPDGVEVGLIGWDADPSTTTDPLNPDTDGDGRPDGYAGGPCEDCNNDGRVDPGESDPNVPERFVMIEPGLNLLAYPGNPPPGLDCVELRRLLDSAGTTTEITRLMPGTGTPQLCAPGPGAFPIVAGSGYLVESTARSEAVFPLDVSCPILDLVPGINLVSYSGPDSSLTCFGLLVDLTPSAVSAIQALDATRGGFQSCTFHGELPVGTDFPIEAGRAVIVHARQAVAVSLSGCSQ